MAAHKLDIFAALEAVDYANGDWFAQQPAESVNGLPLPVFLRWASALSGDGDEAECTLVLVNERVNRNMYSLTKEHAELIFRLTASCGLGEPQRHIWLAMVGRKIESSKLTAYFGRFFPDASVSEIDMLLNKSTRQGFLDFLDETGCPPVDAAEMIKAYDKLKGIEPEAPSAKKAKSSRRAG